MTRYVTYQFDWGFATYDRNTEQEVIDTVEQEATYLSKFDVNLSEAELIQEGAEIQVVDNEVVVVPQEEG